jgi:hypothetical protein
MSRIRLGVFDRQMGDRVPVLSSNFPLADAGTSTVVALSGHASRQQMID